MKTHANSETAARLSGGGFRSALVILRVSLLWMATMAGGMADVLNEDWVLRVAGKVVAVEPDGSFRIPNISTPDQFGAGGPGTAPDFVADDLSRLVGIKVKGSVRYVFSKPFRIPSRGVYRIDPVADLTFTDTPIPLPESLTISAPRRTMTAIGQTVPLTVTSKQLGGGALDVTASSQWTTYRTSNAKIVNVNAEGVCTAVAPGTVFLTATNEGVSSVFQMDVSIGDPLTTVTGTVVGPGGAPAAGVSVTVSVDAGGFSSTTLTNEAGMFSVPCVPTLAGGLCLSGYRTGGGQTSYFIAGGISPVPGGVTVTGTHTLLLNDSAFVLIPGGAFQMGDSFREGQSDERPVHPVNVSAFFLQARETTKAEWDAVRTWARANGYTINSLGGGKASNHPVHYTSWYDVVKWCNARSDKEGLVPCYYTNAARTQVYKTGNVNVTNDQVLWTANGYRLPTEAEWEKAARGGLEGKRFPWGDTITHSLANYVSQPRSYDNSPTRGYHPAYAVGSRPFTSPVGSFAPNGYGLYDMTGNVWEWCWDWYQPGYYSSGAMNDPRGPTSGFGFRRVFRGDSWYSFLLNGRVAMRYHENPGGDFNDVGFRPARGR
jgi:formylglycine-generating enzyme required for sulfatase activity